MDNRPCPDRPTCLEMHRIAFASHWASSDQTGARPEPGNPKITCGSPERLRLTGKVPECIARVAALAPGPGHCVDLHMMMPLKSC